MRIWIDNDGCPKIVRDMVFRTAERLTLETMVVANRYMHVPISPRVKMICVPGGFDEADNYIAEYVEAGDLVVTSDVPLAGRVVAKGAWAINARGDVYDSQSIGEQLAMRNLMQELRSGGEIRGGPPPLGDADKKRFADAFDRIVSKLSRAAKPPPA